MAIYEAVEADDDYYHMYRFHCMFISGQQRNKYIRHLAEEDEEAGIRARRVRHAVADRLAIKVIEIHERLFERIGHDPELPVSVLKFKGLNTRERDIEMDRHFLCDVFRDMIVDPKARKLVVKEIALDEIADEDEMNVGGEVIRCGTGKTKARSEAAINKLSYNNSNKGGIMLKNGVSSRATPSSRSNKSSSIASTTTTTTKKRSESASISGPKTKETKLTPPPPPAAAKGKRIPKKLIKLTQGERLKLLEESTMLLMESNKELTASNKLMTKQIEVMLVAVMTILARVTLSEVVGDEVEGSDGGSSWGRWRGLPIGAFMCYGRNTGINPMNPTPLRVVGRGKETTFGQNQVERSDSEGERTYLYNSFAGLNLDVESIDKFADSRDVEGLVNPQGLRRTTPNPSDEPEVGDGLGGQQDLSKRSPTTPVIDNGKREVPVLTDNRERYDPNYIKNQEVGERGTRHGTYAGHAIAEAGHGLAMSRAGYRGNKWARGRAE
ncbi:hypothetical protein GIB67_038352 [Kingdonia uniflora]|uniref:Uncharacterized protein n=1 Tax=Kingdonia uniflora TaxID=39325 RepID=A0A7J7KUN7_9MAGN|nr:hypothetical protein GIB67_038352 [Kingdonia uniflora]